MAEAEVRSEELYPPSAPNLETLALASSSSSSSVPESEGGDALDLSAFPGANTLTLFSSDPAFKAACPPGASSCHPP